MSESLQNLPVIRHYNVLSERLNVLVEKIDSMHLGVDLLYKSDIKPFKAVSKTISALCYQDEQVGRELVQLPGVVFIPQSLVEDINSVNKAKQDFLFEVKKFKSQSGINSNEGALSKLREVFAANEIGRVHFKQCERKIVVVTNLPKKIRWYKESGGWGSQKKFTKQEAIKLVERQMSDNEDGRKVCTSLLSRLSDSELIVQRNKSPDSIRVNLTYAELSPSSHIASLPIFVVVESLDQANQIKLEHVSETSKNNGTKKNRSKFEDTAYIENLRLFRYKESYR